MSSDAQCPLPAFRNGLLRAAAFAFVLVVAVGATGADKKLDTKPYALIFGTVWSAQQQPVSGVIVKIRPAEAKKPKWELVSDMRGEFAQRLPGGDYVVWAEVKGRKGPAAETKVHADEGVRQDIGLHLTE